MLTVHLNENEAVVHIKPEGRLAAEDFQNLNHLVDPYIEKHGDLKGLIVESEAFPGWDSFNAFMGHMRFVKNHHQRIGKVALVTNTKIADVAESLSGYILQAKVKHFAANDMAAARDWISH